MSKHSIKPEISKADLELLAATKELLQQIDPKELFEDLNVIYFAYLSTDLADNSRGRTQCSSTFQTMGSFLTAARQIIKFR